MDDLGIWQRSLSSNDILSIYANGLNGKHLSEEMDPISIESINAEGQNLTITFFTPFYTRTHSLESKSDLGQAWMAVDGVNLVDLGEGRYRTTVSAADPQGFYQVVSLPPPPVFSDDFESGAEGWTHGGSQDEWELEPQPPVQERPAPDPMSTARTWTVILKPIPMPGCNHRSLI